MDVKSKIYENPKYFAFTEMRTRLYKRHPVPLRGASAIVTNEGRVAVDAGSAENERRESVRQRRVVLTPHCWRRRWQQYTAHRGDHVIIRKAIAQGMSDVLRFTCMLMRALSVHVAHEIAGAARIRHSLRPLIGEGVRITLQTSGATRREKAKLYPPS